MINITHYPYFNKKGDEIPSATTVIGLLNKPDLVYWANWLGFNGLKVDTVKNSAALAGTLAHYLIERKCKKKIISYSVLNDYNESVVKKAKTSFKSFKKWHKEHKPKYIHNELRLQNQKYGGTIDCVCEIDGETFIIDFKTSKQVYPTMFLQLAAYNKLIRDEKGIDIDNVAILILNKNKIDFSFYKMKVKYLEKFYEPIFMSLLDVYLGWNENLKSDWNTKL